MQAPKITLLDSLKRTDQNQPIAHNATLLLSDITGGNSQDHMQLPLEPQKALYYFIDICSRTPTTVNTQ